jgi:hypothetical protein
MKKYVATIGLLAVLAMPLFVYGGARTGAIGTGGSMTYPSGTGVATVSGGTSWGTTTALGAAYTIFRVDSTGLATEFTDELTIDELDLTSGTSSIPWVVGTTTWPTAEGSAKWDSTNNVLYIGDGAASKKFVPQTNEKLAVFNWDGGGAALTAAAGTKRCTFVPSAATIVGVYASSEAESTSDVTVALYKDAFAAGTHATTALISGTNAVTIPSAGTVLNVNDTTLTNWTKTIAAGDQICATITATDTTKWIQLTIYGTR